MVKIQALCNLSESRKLALNNNYCVTTVLCLEGGPFVLFLGENNRDIILIYLASASSIDVYELYFFLVVRLYCSVPVHPDRARVSKAVCLYVSICYCSVCLHCICSLLMQLCHNSIALQSWTLSLEKFKLFTLSTR